MIYANKSHARKNAAIWGVFWAVLRALKEAFGAPITDGACLEEDEKN